MAEETAPTNPFNRPEFQEARTGAYEATGRLGQAAANLTELPDALREAVSERFQQSPLHGQFEGAAQNFLTAVPQARADLAGMVQGGGPILNPNQQQAILAGRRASAMVPLISLNDLIQSQFGTLEDLIGAGTRAYGAQTQRLAAEAELKQQYVADFLNQLQQEVQMRQFAENLGFQQTSLQAGLEMDRMRMAQQQAQFEAQMELDRRMFEEGIRQFDLGHELDTLLANARLGGGGGGGWITGLGGGGGGGGGGGIDHDFSQEELNRQAGLLGLTTSRAGWGEQLLAKLFPQRGVQTPTTPPTGTPLPTSQVATQATGGWSLGNLARQAAEAYKGLGERMGGGKVGTWLGKKLGGGVLWQK